MIDNAVCKVCGIKHPPFLEYDNTTTVAELQAEAAMLKARIKHLELDEEPPADLLTQVPE